MGGILSLFFVILSLFFVIIGYVILYFIIKSAINGSFIINIDNEIRTIRNQNTRQNEDVNKQLEEIKQLLKEQNELLREQR